MKTCLWGGLVLVVGGGCAADPAGFFATRKELRSLDCRRITQAEGANRFPGQVPEPSVRGQTFSDTDAVICERRMLDGDERPPRDEAILSGLSTEVGDLVKIAATTDGTQEALWHVDAFYPEPQVAAKIAVAARTTLAEQGRAVSDRVPILAAGDVAVVSRLPPGQSYAIACKRYFAEKSLGEHDVFLALMIVDPSESQLHAGVCAQGHWRWLR